jgi:hypothetical protein
MQQITCSGNDKGDVRRPDTRSRQHAADNMQQTTCNHQRAADAHKTFWTTCNRQHAAGNVLHTKCSRQHAADNSAAHNEQQNSCNAYRATNKMNETKCIDALRRRAADDIAADELLAKQQAADGAPDKRAAANTLRLVLSA